MNIKIICVGSLKENYLQAACAEYIKRLKKYCSISIIELNEAKLADNASPAQIQQAVSAESSMLLNALNSKDYVIALDVGGVQLSSNEFAQVFSEQMNSGKSSFCLLIGGSNGFDDSVRKCADMVLSFSKLTFPHQLFRVIVLEQVYRAMKILNNERYHK